MLLKDKLILITGASTGIGFATAKKCAENGAKLILVARSKSDLVNAARLVHAKHCWITPADIGINKVVQNLARWVKNKFGHLDGLVNCAGIIGPIGPLHKIKLSEFTRTIQTNFFGTVYACYYFAPLLKYRNAKIVNFSGGGATGPFVNFSAYASSKSAVVRLTENLSQELKSLQIAVNAVAPGFVMTKIQDQIMKAGKKAGSYYLKIAKQEIKRGGVPPERGASLTVFLLSRKSDGVNGKLISAPWDPWEKGSYIQRLKTEKNLATLRRIDSMNYFEGLARRRTSH